MAGKSRPVPCLRFLAIFYWSMRARSYGIHMLDLLSMSSIYAATNQASHV
jgi:hypothetical protein